MGAPAGFICYRDHMVFAKGLSDEELGRLFRALFRYFEDGEGTDFTNDTPLLSICYEVMQRGIDRGLERFAEISAKRSEAGKRGASVTNEKRQKAANAGICHQRSAKGGNGRQPAAKSANGAERIGTDRKTEGKYEFKDTSFV